MGCGPLSKHHHKKVHADDTAAPPTDGEKGIKANGIPEEILPHEVPTEVITAPPALLPPPRGPAALERNISKQSNRSVRSELLLRQASKISHRRSITPVDPRILSEPDHSSLPDGSQLLDRFREVFEGLQANDIGGVTPHRLEGALKSFAKSLPKELETRINIVVADVFEAVDKSRDGIITWDEFDHWLRSRSVESSGSDEAMATLFELCDINEDGLVSAEELMEVFLLMSQYQCAQDGEEEMKLTPDVAQAIVRDLDSSGEGGINMSEFIDIIRAVRAQQHSTQPKLEEGSPPHLVLNFDVNNTVVMFDSATNADTDKILSMIVSNSAWGKIIYDEEGIAQSWELASSELSPASPASGLKTYSEFVREANPLPEIARQSTTVSTTVSLFASTASTPSTTRVTNSNSPEYQSIVDLRRQLCWDFTKPGQPGECFRPKMETMTNALLLPENIKGSEKAVQAGLTGSLVNLLPSFLNFVLELKRTGRSFTLIFRTFGRDLARVAQELNALCEGQHPCYSNDIVLDGTDGHPDYRMRLHSDGCGTFFRDPDEDFIALAMGTIEQPSSLEEGIDFFKSKKDAKVIAGMEAVSNHYAKMSDKRKTFAMRDFYLGWKNANFKPCGGKPFFVEYLSDPSRFSVFFDDHISPASPKIVDPINARQYPRRFHSSQMFGSHLVQAQPLHSILNPDYFVETLQRCEAARFQKLARWNFAKKLLGRLVDVHELLNLFIGAGESALSSLGSSCEELKYRPWSESDAVRRGSAVQTFEEDDPTEHRPLKFGTEAARQSFITGKWQPFIATLDNELAEVQRRHASGYSAREIMPSQGRIQDLCHENLQLSAEWHGRGNISVVYEFLMQAAELDGHSAYHFADLPQQRSSDGFIRVIDGSARKRLYKPSSQGTSCSSIGTIPQAAGESPIDNLVLPNVMKRSQALRVFVGSRVQQIFVNWISKQQKSALRNLGADDLDMESEAVRAKLLSFSSEELSAAKVRADSLWWKCLVTDGAPIASYGQLPEDVRKQGETWLDSVFPGDEPLDEEMASFVEHCKAKPGRNVSEGPVRHKFLLMRAMCSSSVRVASRTDIERFTQHRYLSLPWTRTLPLIKFDEGGAELIVRSAGSIEHSRFRKNVFAYGESHGLSQCAGGYSELPIDDKKSARKLRPYGVSIETTLYELGTAMVQDESGKIVNHWCTDIEKIIHEACTLSPQGGETDALPGEVFHDVGQNPTISSSVGATQHTQIMRAAAEDFPLMLLSSRPLWVDALKATVDIVQIGTHEDAFAVQIRTKQPDSTCILQLLMDLRVHITSVFGSRGVDFNFVCSPIRCTGGYVINMAPVACMQKIDVPAGTGILGLNFDFMNPDLLTRMTDCPGLPCATVDCSHGKGNILGVNEEYFNLSLQGKSRLVELYDFNRKPESRTVTALFLQDRCGYEDAPCDASNEVCYGLLGSDSHIASTARLID
eukprot:gnl/MRDRNA2_/MRDRNA2_56300_c0_seq1.p1 gnl/MRDRNA2_/MRDRNA2_56300_c0~~gnl/MRDRNA2_/MRDRNA2_56300_c0_seq1.p1  ORF type:complete len:1452 (+),score=235.13 gnl/MRDRNA2_/MRDRNA2_56300_c0_seq1:78-4433(+)